MTLADAEKKWDEWFAHQGWKAFSFQKNAWSIFLRGGNGLISVPTGAGKTYAAIGGPLIELIQSPQDELSILYISPLKAVGRDIVMAIRKPIEEMNLPLSVELRCGDTSSYQKIKMREKLPHVLVITPESLALMLTENAWRERFKFLRAIIIDEWHELMSSKRGSLLELTLALLRSAAPRARTWTLSATLKDLRLAAQVAVGTKKTACVIEEKNSRPVEVHSILPPTIEQLPWFGHSGLRLIERVIEQIDLKISTLIFLNTRSQAEKWYQETLRLRPDWSEIMAIHHGSLEREQREIVEEGIKSGHLKIVVATSSLDLGVDFPHVEKVIQIGSLKGYGRALQRAGRSFHRPGATTQLWICPTHALEIIEVSAIRRGIESRKIEDRRPFHKPLDVLVQFLLNAAFDEGYTRDGILEIVRNAYSFRDTTDAELDWALQFLSEGGYSLQAYPQFKKIGLSNGRYQFSNMALARQHKLSIGTILDEASVRVCFPRGKTLGNVQESFVSRLRPGDSFIFAGKKIKLLQMRDMTAYVRLSHDRDSITPIWNGTNLPISAQLSDFMRKEVERVATTAVENLDPTNDKELIFFQPLAQQQMLASHIPLESELLVELWKARDGFHLFCYPFEGRLVHEGLGHLVAFRLSQIHKNTFAVSVNDHGFELISNEDPGQPQEIFKAITETKNLFEDIEKYLNYPELARRSFREIARIAGMIQSGYPSQSRSARLLQMSASLLFDVFQRYEPNHPLLLQAFQNVKSNQLELDRMKRIMEEMFQKSMIFRTINRVTPFAFPLVIERMRSGLSTENIEDRLGRLQGSLQGGSKNKRGVA